MEKQLYGYMKLVFFADEIEKLVPKRHSIKEQELIVERVIDEKFGNFLDKIAEEEFWNISGRSFK